MHKKNLSLLIEVHGKWHSSCQLMFSGRAQSILTTAIQSKSTNYQEVNKL